MIDQLLDVIQITGIAKNILQWACLIGALFLLYGSSLDSYKHRTRHGTYWSSLPHAAATGEIIWFLMIWILFRGAYS